jgi:hypothetical protein
MKAALLVLAIALSAGCQKPSAQVTWKAPAVGTRVVRDGDRGHRELEVLEAAGGATKVRVRYDADTFVVSLVDGDLKVTAPDGAPASKAHASSVADDVRAELGPPSGLMKVLIARRWPVGRSVPLTKDDAADLDVDRGHVVAEKASGGEARFRIQLVKHVGAGELSAAVPIVIQATIDTARGRVLTLQKQTELPGGTLEFVDRYTYQDP